MTKTKNIAIIGFGNVGRGFYELYTKLNNPAFRIGFIAERHPEKLPEDLRHLFLPATEVVSHPHVDLVVEVTNSAEEAFLLVEEALREGKSVVSANKKMLARHLEVLQPFIQKKRLKYEAAACASIPVFRILEGFYSDEPVQRIRGIFNGTCNYLLTRMEQEGRELPELITDAQALGFAEADPTDDVDGFDTLYKLVLLIQSTWGVVADPASVAVSGIRNVTQADIQRAAAQGKRYKLVAEAVRENGQIRASVGVQLLDSRDPLHHTIAENNIFQIEGEWSGPQHYTGRGAGSWPTGKSVLQDVIDLSGAESKTGTLNSIALLN